MVVAAVIASAVLAARALSLPAPYARAALSEVEGIVRGGVAALADDSDNEVSSSDAGEGPVTWKSGRSVASSYIYDGALISTATVSLTGVEIVDGRITAESIELVASAASTRSHQSGGVDVSRIEGLVVDGEAVAVDDLPLAIADLGTLSALERREASEGNGLEAEIFGLRLQLSQPWKALPEGVSIVVGLAAACADGDTAAQLLPSPAPDAVDEAGGSGSGGSGSGGSGGGGGGGGGAGGGSAGASSSDDSSYGGGSTAASFRPGRMRSPRKPAGELLSFPGAVFPVDGDVWYGDDFGAPRAVGGGHTGNDIFARMGTPVVAVQSGVVTEIRYRSLGGNSFHLTNDAGDYFYYAHLLRYAAGIEEGTYVEAGQVLGYVGNTGNAITTPPHLHFEIHPGGGAPIDPHPYLELWRVGVVDALDSDSAGELVQEPQDAGPPAVSIEAERGRHEQAVVLAGMPAGPLQNDGTGGGLLPAAVAFGVAGGLVTTAVRRRAHVYLLTMDPGELHRAAKAG
jgi:murein DD-endopeptidase MepM/ murein hydrolase activator NlpD